MEWMEELAPDLSPPNERNGASTFGYLFILTKISFAAAPGIGNLLIAGYIYFKELPKSLADENLSKKFRLLAALNVLFSVIAIAIGFVLITSDFVR